VPEILGLLGCCRATVSKHWKERSVLGLSQGVALSSPVDIHRPTLTATSSVLEDWIQTLTLDIHIDNSQRFDSAQLRRKKTVQPLPSPITMVSNPSAHSLSTPPPAGKAIWHHRCKKGANKHGLRPSFLSCLLPVHDLLLRRWQAHKSLNSLRPTTRRPSRCSTSAAMAVSRSIL
jgi:hypothetical protein